MFYYFLGVVLLSYGAYFYKRYTIKRIVNTEDKTIQTIVETVSVLQVSEPSSPMSLRSDESQIAYIFHDYKIKST